MSPFTDEEKIRLWYLLMNCKYEYSKDGLNLTHNFGADTEDSRLLMRLIRFLTPSDQPVYIGDKIIPDILIT